MEEIILTIQEVYEKINGDYEDVLTRLPREELVKKFAVKFLDDPSFDQLVKALEEDNQEEAFRAAHTLKGVCLNLGFKVLYESTYNITEALRPGNPKLGKEELHNLFKELDKDYNIVINGIKELD